jgi:hypothetical protein
MPMKDVMSKFKAGTLRSGSGSKVTSPKQAIAIGLSYEGKAEGGRVMGTQTLSRLRSRGIIGTGSHKCPGVQRHSELARDKWEES